LRAINVDNGKEITSKLPVLLVGIEVKLICLHAKDSRWRWLLVVFWAADPALHAASNGPHTKTPAISRLAIMKHFIHQVLSGVVEVPCQYFEVPASLPQSVAGIITLRMQRKWKEVMSMKTMTCKQLGGPSDVSHHGTTADEVIKAQDRHLKEMVASGDKAHEQAAKEMKGRWKNPIKGMGWYKKAKSDFARLPED
jgi:hypothetical protein